MVSQPSQMKTFERVCVPWPYPPSPPPPAWGFKATCTWLGNTAQGWRRDIAGTPNIEAAYTVVPKPVGEVQQGLKGNGNATVDGIKVEVWMQVVMYEQPLYEVVLSPLFECIVVMESVTEECVPYPVLQNTRHVNLPLPILIGCAEWELANCLSPHRLLIGSSVEYLEDNRRLLPL